MRFAIGCHAIALSILLMVCFCPAPALAGVAARQGVLDLSKRDFSQGEVVHLNGEWEFYWGRLLSPADLDRPDSPPPTGFFYIPGYWNGRVVEGRALSGDGCATFRLRVRLRPGTPPLAVRIEDQASAYRLWVNGREVLDNGRVGKDALSSIPYYRISTASLPAGADHLECVLQVSNFHLLSGGPCRGIALGSVEAIGLRHFRLLAVDLLLFGILVIMGIYHLIFFFLRRREPSPFYFGWFCLSWGIAAAFGATSGRFVTLFLPNIPWYWLSRTDLFCWIVGVPLGLLFLQSLFPLDVPHRFVRWCVRLSIPFLVYLVVVPSRYLGWAVFFYEIFSLAMVAWVIWILVGVWRRKREGFVLFSVGLVALMAAVVNDTLYMNLAIDSVYLIPVGILVMILCQALMLSRRFARSFSAVESLTAALEEKNTALSRLDGLKDEFLANTSHELRTPLNGIIGIAESLIGGAAGNLPEKTLGNLSLIVSSGRRLSHLINDILDFSRLKHRDIVLREKPVDLFSLGEVVLSSLRPLTEGKDLALVNAIPRTLPPVRGDENRLQQVFYNLIGNSVKFTESGEIRITARERGPLIEVSVVDTGIGIPEDRQELIFHSFEQADTSDSRAYGGAGLGLSITKQLVELHGGTIRVVSSPGQGADFRFTLPSLHGVGGIAGTVPAERPVPPPPLSPPLISVIDPVADLPGIEGNVTILAVDDDPVNLQVVTNCLPYRNLKLLTAAGGREALGILEGGVRPDLVLLDLMMPHLSGYDVCRWLRGRYSPNELPVIMLTAKDAPGDLARGFAEGANDYLVKPFLREELVARVASQLKLLKAYLTLRENLSLRKELEERKRSEQDLRSWQRRLNSMLDGIEDTLLAVNESGEITFCNRRGERLLGYRAEDLLGRPFHDIVQLPEGGKRPGNGDGILHEWFSGEAKPEWRPVTLITGPGTCCSADIFPSRLELEEEPICLMILRNSSPSSGATLSPETFQTLAVVEAINHNRVRLQSIQGVLNGFWPTAATEQSHLLAELRTVDKALDDVSRVLVDPDRHESRRHLAVEVMNISLDYWTQCSGLAKADLARRSGLWKVYTNQDGWERTQTLDRYLQIATFPQRPLWNKIVKSAEFVLSAGTVSSPLRTRLEVLLDRLQSEK
jgi:two-component system sensor histidine kinase ChiS